jgi:hypothetical protein
MTAIMKGDRMNKKAWIMIFFMRQTVKLQSILQLAGAALCQPRMKTVSNSSCSYKNVVMFIRCKDVAYGYGE